MLNNVHFLLNTLRSSILACAVVPLWCAPSAHAALMENLGIGVVPMSMGNAVTADPSGLDAMLEVQGQRAGITKVGFITEPQ